MDARAFDKSKLPSRYVAEGPSRAPHLREGADSVGPACKGAVTHAGGSAEVVCYADI